MAIAIDIPPDLEQQLRRDMSDLDQVAREAALVELFRRKKITHFQLSELLGISRYETDGVLKAHEVYLDITLEDVQREAALIEAIRK